MHTGARCHSAGRLRGVRWGVCGALALAGATLPARTALADPLAGIDVRWSGPQSCVDRGEVTAEARRLLPSDGAYEPTQIDITVSELKTPRAGYQLMLSARSAARTAERALELASCDEARQAAGLLIALMLDPEAVAAAESVEPHPIVAPPEPPTPAPAAEPEPQPSPSVPPKAEPAPPPAAPTVSAPQAPAKLVLGPELHAGALLDSSALPAVAVGPFASAGFRIGVLRLALGALYLPGAERSASAQGSIRASLFGGQLAACAMWRVASAFEVGPCASGELGRYAARARGVTHGESDATLWAAVSAGASAALSLSSRLALEASVALLAPLRRPVLGLRAMEATHRVPPLSLRAALGVRWF